MNFRRNITAITVTLLILIGMGIWLISQGNIAFGSSMIGAAIGVGLVRYIEMKKIREMQAKGLNPYDERIVFITGKASHLTLTISILLAAGFILIGSVFGPELQVNPYNFLGFCLAVLILIYVAVYYRYSKDN